jgi:ubiquinone/menaquinone biosynthesis C-methylase UbiE
MSLRSRLFAAGYDRFTAATEEAGLAAHRRNLLADASGRVLEIGAGTGANLQHYGDGVTELTTVEPEEAMARRLARRAREDGRLIELVQAPAEDLPFEDGRFDVAVSTLVLCTVDDQARALGELRRVLRPGGRLLFLEHVRADEPGLARWQDRLNGINRFLVCGCNCNRRTLEAIEAAGFSIATLTRDRLPKAPPFARPLVVGAAETAGS